MALSGKLLADFSDFTTAVAKSEVSLKAFESDAGKVETALNRVTNSLSGTKLIQDATLMVEAVERVGGVSRLTERELAKVSAQAKEAAEKLTAMGKDVPPGLQQIAAATRDATASTVDWKSALLSVAGVFGVAFSLNAVKNFAVGIVATASDIGDLAVKLDASADAVQRWQYAADLAGTSIDTVDRAVQFMNRTLSEGGTGTVAALKKAGLSFAEIRTMRPEDAFDAITAAVAEIEDPMIRAEVATRLFGRAGQEMIPAMVAGFAEVAKGARVMSDDTIARLKNAEDAWTKLKHHVTIISGEYIAEVTRIHSSWKQFGLSLVPESARVVIRVLADDTDLLAAAMKGLPPVSVAASDGLRAVALDADQTKAAISALDADINKSMASNIRMAEAQEELNNAGEGWRRTLAAMNADAVAAVQVYLSMGASQSALATHYGLTALQVKAVAKALAEQMATIARADGALVQSAANLTKQLIANGQTFNAEWQKEINQFSQMAALAKQLQQEIRPEAAPTAGETLEQRTKGFEQLRGIWTDAQVNQALNDLYESFYRSEGAKGNMPGTSYAPPALLSPGTSLAPTSTIINNTITMNGILATSDPSGKAALRSAVDDALMAGAKQGRKF